MPQKSVAQKTKQNLYCQQLENFQTKWKRFNQGWEKTDVRIIWHTFKNSLHKMLWQQFKAHFKEIKKKKEVSASK